MTVNSVPYKSLASARRNVDAWTLNQILDLAREETLTSAYCMRMVSYGSKKKIRINQLLPTILMFVERQAFIWEIKRYFNFVNPRSLRRYIKILVDKKWLIRVGNSYKINPLLAFLIFRVDTQYVGLIEYSAIKVDLFDLLNYPLTKLLEQKAKKITVRFFERNNKYLKPVFAGVVEIRAELSDGNKVQTILPLNLHAQSQIVGRTKISKKPIVNPKGIKHYCIPLRWRLLDVKRCEYWSRKRRTSRWDKNLKSLIFLHFDNSFSLLYAENLQVYWMFKKPYEKAVKKWSGYEYLEFCEFETVQKLFEARFIQGKRGSKLFRSLGLTQKKLSRRHLKTRREYIQKIQPIPLSRLEKTIEPKTHMIFLRQASTNKD